jgi:hypothetical protein
MAFNMASAKCNLRCLTRFSVNRKLAETALHSARKPDGDGRQPATEVSAVQLGMERFQPVDQANVSRPGVLPACSPQGRRNIGLNWKIEELSFCSSTERPGNSRIQEAHHRL